MFKFVIGMRVIKNVFVVKKVNVLNFRKLSLLWRLLIYEREKMWIFLMIEMLVKNRGVIVDLVIWEESCEGL